MLTGLETPNLPFSGVNPSVNEGRIRCNGELAGALKTPSGWRSLV